MTDQPSWGSSMVGGNGLQEAIDKLTGAVQNNTTALQQSKSNSPGGTSVPYGNSGQSFTRGVFPSMVSPTFGGSEGSYATSPGPSGGQGNGQGGWGQAMGNPAGTVGGAVSTMGSMASSFFSNSPQFSNQILMNQYASMSTLGMGPGANLSQGFKAMYSQAFGNYGRNVNAIASNPADAAQMYSTLQGITGNPYVMSTPQGRAGYGSAAAFGIGNMGQLSGAQSAQAAAQVYAPQTSMTMRQLGYSALPRQGANGQWSNMAQVAQGMFQRWYGKGSTSQSTLNAGLANGGRANLNLQALGMDPSTMGPALQTYNKLFQQGMTANNAQTLLNDAAQNKKYDGQSAQKLLSNKYGIATSDLQKLKDTTGVQTSNTAGEMGGFDSAVSQATTTVQKFDTALGEILKVTGLGTMVGASHGMSGTMGAVGGAVGGIFKNAMGMGMGMLSRLGGASGGITAGGGSITAGGVSGNSSGSKTSTNSSGNASGAAKTAISDALAQVGRPYVWGGDSPSTSFDCSGLIEWAYSQAGIKLPRTSQEQWDALKNRSVALNSVRAGDIVFSAGSDGTSTAPGHEALMISNKEIVEAPYTGANIRTRAYNPGEWQHAGRPSGNLAGGVTQNGSGGTGSAGGTSGSNGTGSSASGTGKGNGGLGLAVGSYGSSNEVDNLASALLGGGLGGGGTPGIPGTTMGSASVGNAQGSGGSTSSLKAPANASASQAQAIAKKLAAAYGWGSGTQWNDLVQLWTDESSWNYKAENASGAYGIPQALPGNKMASAGPDWRTNAATQIKWGLSYIKQRWKNPAGALANENAAHWYADGTDSAHSGYALLGDRGPELVRMSGGQQVKTASQTADILKGHSAKVQSGTVSTGASLMLANQPQNQAMTPAKAEVNLNFPQGAIVIHTNGSASDVSSNVRQITAGVAQAMADNETLKKIMSGVTS